jgi:membrane protease YdiL (CAAX protease family)
VVRRADPDRSGGRPAALCRGAPRLPVRRPGLAVRARRDPRRQGSAGWRWPAIRDALWLRAPSENGRCGGRLWLWAAPFAVGFAAVQFLPVRLPALASHDFGIFLGSADGRSALHGNWGLFALSVAMFVFNTVLGEELLFRGLLLPRMRGAFGRYDWIVNAVLFGAYHLHQPWSILGSMLDGMMMSYPTRRWRSAWLGILVHPAQSAFLAVLLLTLVL